jgi:quinol monooxygenase YgiN
MLGDEMSRFGLMSKITAHPGQGQALRHLMIEAAEVVAEAPGCDVWIVSVSPDDPDAIWVTEIWRSEHDHAASLTDERVREIIARACPLIADFSERVTLQPIAGKGLTDIGSQRD